MIFAPRWRRAAQGPRHRHRSGAATRRHLRKPAAHGRHDARFSRSGEPFTSAAQNAKERRMPPKGGRQDPVPGTQLRAPHEWHSHAPGHFEAWAFAYSDIHARMSVSGGRRIRSDIGQRGKAGMPRTERPRRKMTSQQDHLSATMTSPAAEMPIDLRSRGNFRHHRQAAGPSGDFPADAVALWFGRSHRASPFEPQFCS